ncbi:hypothetical protein ACQCU1_06330 [Sutcliffiella horikoshii]|uniref:Uncharacterized protein n=1 Tax=Sutcliffiella horikoshii TaxID=79883 RepID=A0A1Y0CM30_9BACI|nr:MULTISPECIES: hypothetical protein [Bacillaceae]ART76134.1 hypothetical protein B4U37_08825 [Sutcliffiella horikoshii]TYS68590.1 hypothetical protein FZC75_18025 [Sutcliffiella horikoshii]
MRKLKKPVRLTLALIISLFLFMLYIHTTKEEVIASAVKESNQNGVSLSLQNPYVMPIKVSSASMVDGQEKELPITAYSIKLKGVYSGGNSSLDQSFMTTQTEEFEELEEVTIPSDTSKKEEIYSIYITDQKREGSVEAAEKVKITFKIFSFLPITTTISL